MSPESLCGPPLPALPACLSACLRDRGLGCQAKWGGAPGPSTAQLGAEGPLSLAHSVTPRWAAVSPHCAGNFACSDSSFRLTCGYHPTFQLMKIRSQEGCTIVQILPESGSQTQVPGWLQSHCSQPFGPSGSSEAHRPRRAHLPPGPGPRWGGSSGNLYVRRGRAWMWGLVPEAWALSLYLVAPAQDECPAGPPGAQGAPPQRRPLPTLPCSLHMAQVTGLPVLVHSWLVLVPPTAGKARSSCPPGRPPHPRASSALYPLPRQKSHLRWSAWCVRCPGAERCSTPTPTSFPSTFKTRL